MNHQAFEQGPIRPPNEARSLLLRFTRNCPWNQCLFCPVYKGRRFSLRTVEEIKKDIQTARDIADDIKALSWQLGCSGSVTDEVITHIFSSPAYSDAYRSIAAWLYHGTGACFLQDADNLVMATGDMVEALEFLREKFPDITRVTTYSRSRTIVRKSPESLKRLREAGLNRVHVGLESGYDPVLKMMKKGVTGAQHVEAGRMVVGAGMELSEYVMPGLGGRDLWKEHAVSTADVLNQINPHFIRIRTLRVPDRIPLFKLLKEGSFQMQNDDMLAEEIKLFIRSLSGITSTVTSDHIMNLLEEVTGKLPEDQGKMLEVIAKYQEMPDWERLVFRVGRRGGAYRSTEDVKRDPATYRKISNLIEELEAKGGKEEVERFITDMVDQYV
ncbi:MAG: radical SAM protein [Deltaproteobacteria bacterium]|nr:radical SAM protein [Deltaproteobacteria bacterium]